MWLSVVCFEINKNMQQKIKDPMHIPCLQGPCLIEQEKWPIFEGGLHQQTVATANATWNSQYNKRSVNWKCTLLLHKKYFSIYPLCIKSLDNLRNIEMCFLKEYLLYIF